MDAKAFLSLPLAHPFARLYYNHTTMSISSDCSSQVRFPLPACSHNHDHLSGNDKEVQIYSQITTHSVCFSTCSPNPKKTPRMRAKRNIRIRSLTPQLRSSWSAPASLSILFYLVAASSQLSSLPFLIPCSPVLPVSSEGCLLHWEKVMAHRIGMLYLAWPGWLAGSNQSSSRRRDD